MAQIKTMSSRIPFSMNLTAEQLAALQAEAQRIQRPMGYLVRQILEEWCARVESRNAAGDSVRKEREPRPQAGTADERRAHG